MLLPIGFSRVTDQIYRCAYPANKALSFIDTLNLTSMVSLINPSEIKNELHEYCQKRNILLIEADIGVNKEPFLHMNINAVDEVMEHISTLLESKQGKCLIFCANGKLRTSCMVGCLRKQLLNWNMASIMEEFESFSDGDGDLLDAVFIQNYRYTRTPMVDDKPHLT